MLRGNPAIFFKKSISHAQEFELVIRITQEDASGYGPEIQIDSNNDLIYIVFNLVEGGIGYSVSPDRGATFSKMKTLTDDTNVSELACCF